MSKRGGLFRLLAGLIVSGLLSVPAMADDTTPTGTAAPSAADATTQSSSTAADSTQADQKKDKKDKKKEEGQASSDQADQSSSSSEAAARAALKTKKEESGEESTRKNLEQVFQATQKNYTLLKSGQMSLTFAGNYSYYRHDTIDINFDNNGNLNRFLIQNDAQHQFGASLSADYGVWDNLTFNAQFPVQYKFDTQKNVSTPALGDVSFGFRFQPFPYAPGTTTTTIYGTFSTATGDSPYKIDPTKDVSSGKGYYSMGGGVSLSKVVDPVVLYGSMGVTYAFNATGLNQRRGTRVLKEVDPGDSVDFSFGLAYSLSYEVSLSASYQQSYNFPSHFLFTNGDNVTSQDSTTSVVNMALGLRSAKNQIVNVSFGFGLTPESPNVLLGISVPIDFNGLKPAS